eukprot:431712-Amphidinium_carterae.1
MPGTSSKAGKALVPPLPPPPPRGNSAARRSNSANTSTTMQVHDQSRHGEDTLMNRKAQESLDALVQALQN